MLKLVIASTISLVSLLLLDCVADARAIDWKFTHNPDSQFKVFLTAKQPNASNTIINEAEIKDIHSTIVQFYKYKNEQHLNRELEDSRRSNRNPDFIFCNVKNLQLTYLSELRANVEVKVDMSGYSGTKISDNPVKWKFKKNSGLNNAYKLINSGTISLDKKDGKWVANTNQARCW
jgi:hypothetical protein